MGKDVDGPHTLRLLELLASNRDEALRRIQSNDCTEYARKQLQAYADSMQQQIETLQDPTPYIIPPEMLGNPKKGKA